MSDQERACRDRFVHEGKKADFAKGEREKYFADDDMSLDDMVRREKMSSKYEYDDNLIESAGHSKRKLGKAFDAEEDEYGSQLGHTLKSMESKDKKMKTADLEQKARRQAIDEHNKAEKATNRDRFNLDNPKFPHHLLIAVAGRTYLMLQTKGRLCDGHCIIVPHSLTPSITNCDEDTLEECVFIETAVGFNSMPHGYLECVPVSRNVSSKAPMYFKKALQECENEWEAQNKAVIDTRGVKKLCTKIPKNLPYFSVEFGLQGGFAHVIESETKWSKSFGHDILAGLMGKDAEILKRERSDIAHERKLAELFKAGYEQYDWTKALS